MGNAKIEISVGLFMVTGLLALAILAIKLGDFELIASDRYEIDARFVSSSGLKPGAFVEVGGVRVGKVRDIRLDPETYESIVSLALNPEVILQDDSIASIRTEGIIGDKFVKITPGGSEVLLGPGDQIFETESSISLEELISKYIFESDN